MPSKSLFSSQIIKLHDMFPRGTSLVLVLEYMSCGLREWLQQRPRDLTQPVVKAYAQMMLKGTRYMHAHYVMHRVSGCLASFVTAKSSSAPTFGELLDIDTLRVLGQRH